MSGNKSTDELTGNFNISGAGLKEKKVVINNNEEEEEEEENEEEKETVKLSDTKNSKDDDEEFQVNFNDEEAVNKFTTSKTKDSQNVKEKHFGENETIEDIQNELKKAEEKANDIDPETFYDVADFIITLLDSSVASGLKWWTKDSSHSAYSLPKPNKEKLTKQLAKILIKYNAKFSIELMFIIGLIIMYIPAFRLARSRKKEIEEINAKNAIIEVVKPIVQKQNIVTPNPVVDDIKDLTINNNVDESNIIKPKRKNSRPRKP